MSNEVKQITSLQTRVKPWLNECFGSEIANNKIERNHRFLEESLELVQSLGCTKSEALELVNYTFGRPLGSPPQEVGGVMITLAALCLANGLDMDIEGELELSRIWGLVELIRSKQAGKPKFSPLPQALPTEDLTLQQELAGMRVIVHTLKQQVHDAQRKQAEAEHDAKMAKLSLQDMSSGYEERAGVILAVLQSLNDGDTAQALDVISRAIKRPRQINPLALERDIRLVDGFVANAAEAGSNATIHWLKTRRDDFCKKLADGFLVYPL